MSGLPLRIVYRSPRCEYISRAIGTDYRFEAQFSKGSGSMANMCAAVTSGTLSPEMLSRYLDPYTIRQKFERVKDHEEARLFLCENGPFWPNWAVLYSQFEKWQEFFSWLRQEPEDATKTQEGKKAWLTASGYDNQFFTNETWLLPEESREISPKRIWEIEGEIVQELRLLRSFAHCLGGLPGLRGIGNPNRITLAWYDPKDGLDPADGGAPEDWLARRLKPGRKRGFRPMAYLRIEVQNVLEAIAATIYADRAVGLKYRKCAHRPCNRLFLVTNPKQKFCPHPKIPGESLCKKAHMAEIKRDNTSKPRTPRILIESRPR